MDRDVSVDASRCQTGSSGYFDIDFTRLSETAPDLEFSARYAWRPPSVEVAVNFAANEAVQHFRIENITSCVPASDRRGRANGGSLTVGATMTDASRQQQVHGDAAKII